MTDPGAARDPLEMAFTHASDLYKHYSMQRQNQINYYLLAVALLSTGYAAALNGHRPVAVVVAILGTATSIGALLQDIRNYELTQTAKKPLAEIEKFLAEQLPTLQSIMILQETQRSSSQVIGAGRVLRVLYALFSIAFALGSVYAL